MINSTIPHITIKQYRDAIGSSSTSDSDRITSAILSASLFIQNYCNRRFDNYYDTINHDYSETILGDTLFLLEDLISLTSVENGDGNTLVNSNLKLRPTREKFYSMIMYDYWYYNTSLNDEIVVDGLWGYGSTYKNVGYLISDIDDSTTTIDVSSGQELIVGSLCKINNEFILISDLSANTYTVERSYNGSSATNHLEDDIIYWYRHDYTIEQLTIRLTQWILEQHKSPVYGNIVTGNFEIPVTLDTVPGDITQTLVAGNFVKDLMVGVV